MVVGAQHSFSSLVGTELGGFTIVEEVATGGMGTVYLGQRTGLAGIGQPAAIKVIHPHMAQDRGFVEMFVDEARIASCVHHPNVCGVLDFGKARGTFYLAMEYLSGETWSATWRAVHQDPEAEQILPQILAHVVAQACEGLHAAHEATDQRGQPLHIVHRDVSPQNLFVGYDGGVRVLDFGIASAADRLHTTRFGTVKGRYSYMAPEQMLGDSVDRRSDIWSLGVVLREGLTGHSVFRRATDAETVYAVTHRLVPHWERRVHPELKRIAEKAMQWDPDKRYQSAREMGQDLLRFVHAEGCDVGMPQLSVCMHRLFEERVREKRALLCRAANDNASVRPLLSLPPPPASQPAPAPKTLAPPRVLALEEGTTLEYPTRSDFEREAPTTPEPRFDLEPPTWERELPPTLIRDERRKTTTQELLTFSMPAPVRDSGRGGAFMGLLSVAACLGLVFISGGVGFGPTQVMIAGGAHATSASAAATSSVGSLERAHAAPELPQPLVQGVPVAAPAPVVEPSTNVSPVVEGSAMQPGPEQTAVAAAPAVAALLPAVELAPARMPPRAAVGPATDIVPSERASMKAPKLRARRKPVAGPLPTGKLNIITLNGWADVYLGAKKLGTTPGQFELPRGTHALTLRESGAGVPQREVVQILEGQVSRARITLRR